MRYLSAFYTDIGTQKKSNQDSLLIQEANTATGTTLLDVYKRQHMARADNIFKSAIDNNVETLILGAFGCGAFRNPPELVAEVYKIASLKYRKYFKNIFFSVRDKGELDYNKVVFQQMVLKIGGTVIDGI